MMTHWRCMICKEPVTDGVVQVFNSAKHIEGLYPAERSSRREKMWDEEVEAREGPWLSGVDLFEIDKLVDSLYEMNIDILVSCRACDPMAPATTYWFDTSRAEELAHWVVWVLHLEEKKWMGHDDMVRMLRFWWTHRGLIPEAVSV